MDQDAGDFGSQFGEDFYVINHACVAFNKIPHLSDATLQVKIMTRARSGRLLTPGAAKRPWPTLLGPHSPCRRVESGTLCPGASLHPNRDEAGVVGRNRGTTSSEEGTGDDIGGLYTGKAWSRSR